MSDVRPTVSQEDPRGATRRSRGPVTRYRARRGPARRSRPRRESRAALLAALCLPPLLSGCLAAAAAGAAGGGIYFTTRGAEAIVSGTVEQVSATTLEVFERLDVRHTGQRDEEEGEREIYGKLGPEEHDVTVDLERETDRATRVEVRVRRSAVTWDKDFARKILEEIDKARS